MPEENRSITIEEYETKYKPLLDTAAQLIMDHPEIPDEVVQADVLSGILTLKTELDHTLHNRVPEHVKLQEKITRLEKQNDKLKDTNQQLFMKVGAAPNPSAADGGEKGPPKKSFDEIKRIIEGL